MVPYHRPLEPASLYSQHPNEQGVGRPPVPVFLLKGFGEAAENLIRIQHGQINPRALVRP